MAFTPTDYVLMDCEQEGCSQMRDGRLQTPKVQNRLS